jgi:hypothetical protein
MGANRQMTVIVMRTLATFSRAVTFLNRKTTAVRREWQLPLLETVSTVNATPYCRQALAWAMVVPHVIESDAVL